MGQYWRLVNLDRHAVRAIGKLGSGIWGVNLHNHLLPGVMDPLLPLDQILRNQSRHSPQRDDQKQSRLLTVLPRGVLLHIFDTLGRGVDDIDSRVAVACLSLTCQLCFEIGYSVLKTLQKATHSWAGERLVIAGHSQSPDDLPPSLENDPYWKAARGQQQRPHTRSRGVAPHVWGKNAAEHGLPHLAQSQHA